MTGADFLAGLLAVITAFAIMIGFLALLAYRRIAETMRQIEGQHHGVSDVYDGKAINRGQVLSLIDRVNRDLEHTNPSAADKPRMPMLPDGYMPVSRFENTRTIPPKK